MSIEWSQRSRDDIEAVQQWRDPPYVTEVTQNKAALDIIIAGSTIDEKARRRPKLSDSTRELLVGRYIIIYEIDEAISTEHENCVKILSIWHCNADRSMNRR